MLLGQHVMSCHACEVEEEGTPHTIACWCHQAGCECTQLTASSSTESSMHAGITAHFNRTLLKEIHTRNCSRTLSGAVAVAIAVAQSSHHHLVPPCCPASTSCC